MSRRKRFFSGRAFQRGGDDCGIRSRYRDHRRFHQGGSGERQIDRTHRTARSGDRLGLAGAGRTLTGKDSVDLTEPNFWERHSRTLNWQVGGDIDVEFH